MVDLVRKKGDVIDYRKLSKTLGCEVIPISALKKEGGKKLVVRRDTPARLLCSMTMVYMTLRLL